MNREELETAVRLPRMRIHNAARQFHKFSDMPREQHALCAVPHRGIESLADKIAHHDRVRRPDAEMPLQKVKPVAPRHREKVRPRGQMEFHIRHDGLNQRSPAHRPDNALGPED